MPWQNLLLNFVSELFLFILLNFLLLNSAAAITLRVLESASAKLRILGIITTAICIQQIIFYVLAAGRIYAPLPAALFLIALNIITQGFVDYKRIESILLTDLKDLFRKLKTEILEKLPKSLLLILLGLSIVLCSYVFTNPILGWDGITYHATKAAYWVKEQGDISFKGPGGWLIYRNRIAAGEIYTSWFMLPGSNDTFLPLGELFIWLAMGVSVYVLAAEVGLSRLASALCSILILYLPASLILIGTTYVETFLCTLVISSLAFFTYLYKTRTNNFLIFILATLAVAAATKVSVWIFAGFISVWSLLLVVKRKDLLTIGIALFFAFLLFLPQLISNYLETGLPLAFDNVSLAGINLGHSIEGQWYAFRKLNVSFQLELKAFFQMFALPAKWEDYHLGILTLPLLFCELCSMFLLKGHQRVLFIASSVFLLLPIYTSSFRVIRILWANATSRFWIPIVALAVIALLKKLHKSRSLEVLKYFILSLAIISTFGFLISIKNIEQLKVILITASIIIALIINGFAAYYYSGTIYKVFFCSLLFAGVYSLCWYNQNEKFSNLASFRSPPFLNKYWAEPATLLNIPQKSFKIAVTSGEHQNLDNWHTYYFLGSNFQNNLTYVSPLISGKFPVWDSVENTDVDYPLWLERLKNEKVDFVMSFYPLSQELRWMQSNPDSFRLIYSCKNKHCGLYEIL